METQFIGAIPRPIDMNESSDTRTGVSLLHNEAGLTSPSLTPTAVTEIIEVSLTEPSPTRKRTRGENSLGELKKKAKVEISNNTPSPEVSEEFEKSDKQMTQKQVEKLERQKQREALRLEKEKKKEEERRLKEEERRLKEEERQRKLAEKEAEKESKKRKIEEDKLAKERKREEERIEKERKKEEERLEKERKKEEERLEKELRKEERELQRLEKKKKMEEEKHRKEEEKKQQEEEKRKADEAKERSQMKISAFFSIGAKPKSPTKERKVLAETTKSTPEETILVYNQVFLPFFQKQNVQLPPSSGLDEEKLKKAKTKFDNALSSIQSKSQTSRPHDALKEFFFKRKPADHHQKPTTTPEDIVNALNSSKVTEEDVYQMIRNLNQFKYLQFYENRKPPYIGTWCSKQHLAVKFPISNPLDTSVTGLDYEYDSDLDWNGDEDGEGEGEDIDGDDDEEEEETVMEDDDEMEDFVESNDLSKSAKKYLGPLVAISTWNDNLKESHRIFDDMKYERLDISIDFPIDPFRDYWSKPVPEVTENNNSSLQSGSLTPKSSLPSGSVTTPNFVTPRKPTIQDPHHKHKLILFIEKNNDFSLGTLVELAKKELSAEFQKDNYSKALVKHTIQQVAVYNKKQGIWEIKTDVKDQLCQAIKL